MGGGIGDKDGDAKSSVPYLWGMGWGRGTGDDGPICFGFCTRSRRRSSLWTRLRRLQPHCLARPLDAPKTVHIYSSVYNIVSFALHIRKNNGSHIDHVGIMITRARILHAYRWGFSRMKWLSDQLI